ncbi:MAG: hypothetical protein JWQ72_927 [Polaromonas sp.]|nr:hypothetical protein [Polaromonas sp.]
MPKKSPAAPPALLPHGALRLPGVAILGYSLQLHEGEGFLGDSVSRRAFSGMLDAWRTVYRDIGGKDPFGAVRTEDLSKKALDAMLAGAGTKGGMKEGGSAAAAVIRDAAEDYARQLARVVRRFRAHASWKGVERIVIGGGFQQSEVGAMAVRRTAELLAADGVHIKLRRLRHHPDEGGLIGWVHLAPTGLLRRYQAMLAVDIGGTNLRCGIVRTRARKQPDFKKADVVGRAKWCHSEDASATSRSDLVAGIAAMLEKLMAQAKKQGISLAPFVGVACPGMICEDGSIADGTQNLPGNWESEHFNLPQHLSDKLPPIDGQPVQVMLHNDAVVQGLSELPFMRRVGRWAVLTVGTGLGNASYANDGAAGGQQP